MIKHLRSVDWRREALYPLTAAMEIAWFTPWYLSLIPATARLPALRTAIGLFVTLVIPVYGARLLGRLYLKPTVQRAALAALLLLNCLLALRVLLYAGQGYGGFDWLTETLNDVLDIYELIPDWLVIVLSTLFLWWRGISLGQRRPSVQAVALSFYVGIVSFIGFVLLVNLVTRQDPAPFIPIFFFCSLVALGATRMEEMRGLRGAIRSPFGLSWLFFIALAALVVVCLGALLGALLTGGSFKDALLWLQPLLLLIGLVLGLFLVLLRIVANWLLGFLRSLGAEQAIEPLGELLDRLGDLATTASNGTIKTPPALGALRLLVIIGLVLCLGALVIWMVRRQSWPEREREGEEHTSFLSSAVLLENLRQLVQDGRGRLAAVLGLVGRSGLRGLFAALTVRRIYAQMLRLAATQGYPRAASQTPYEYEATAARAFPAVTAEVHAITEAYVAVHYGEVPETSDELKRIQACWERIKASAGAS